MMKAAPRRIVAVLALAACATAGADSPHEEIVVIVNPASGVDVLERKDAINIFMGRFRKLPSGLVAFPIDVGGRSVEREQFYARLVGRALAEVDAYWSRLVFSGQTSPPLQVPDGNTAVKLVAANRAAIAYVRRADADDRVKIVMVLPEEPPAMR